MPVAFCAPRAARDQHPPRRSRPRSRARSRPRSRARRSPLQRARRAASRRRRSWQSSACHGADAASCCEKGRAAARPKPRCAAVMATLGGDARRRHGRRRPARRRGGVGSSSLELICDCQDARTSRTASSCTTGAGNRAAPRGPNARRLREASVGAPRRATHKARELDRNTAPLRKIGRSIGAVCGT